MQHIGITTQTHTLRGLQVLDINILRHIDYIFTLGLHLHQHLLVRDNLYDLTNVRARLLQQTQFILDETHLVVKRIPLGFQSPQVFCLPRIFSSVSCILCSKYGLIPLSCTIPLLIIFAIPCSQRFCLPN